MEGIDKAQFLELLEKYQAGDATKEEIRFLEAYYAAFGLRNNFSSSLDTKSKAALQQELYGLLNQRITKTDKPPRKLFSNWLRIAVAASVTIAVITGGYFYYHSQIVIHNSSIVQNDIAPGKEGATLTLANGEKIYINDAIAGNIAIQSGVKISKSADGEISYEVISDDSKMLAYNTLTTTRGEQTRVRLPDGTLVFLNAESALRYPTSFTRSKNRNVSLEGEGYFEVAEDKLHPFIVEARNQSVEVLGTHFNINAYMDEKAVKTTLLQGSVRIGGNGSFAPVTLSPGQQSSLEGSGISLKNVEAEDAVAWKQGYFLFNSETLEEIMKDVARWYDIEVIFKDEALRKETLLGSVGRFENISKLIRALETTNAARFEIKGRQIIIDRKKE